jgi:hypothetical protein
MPSPHEAAFSDGYAKGMTDGDQAMGYMIRKCWAQAAELEKRITELQAHNTELLLRARKAEGEAIELRRAIDLYSSASQY